MITIAIKPHVFKHRPQHPRFAGLSCVSCSGAIAGTFPFLSAIKHQGNIYRIQYVAGKCDIIYIN